MVQSKVVSIVVEERNGAFVAWPRLYGEYDDRRKETVGVGSTPAAAVGDLVMRYSRLFDLLVDVKSDG